MTTIARCAVVAAVALAMSLFAAPDQAQAQVPVAVTTYQPVYPTVAYVPQVRGLFGQRLVYRPVLTYAAAAPVTTYYAPAPVTTYYTPAPVTTYYTPPVIYYGP